MHIIKLKTIVNRKTYTFDEAFKASLDYFTGDELAAKVWVNKYALKDAFGNIYEESPVDMHHRLASEIARVADLSVYICLIISVTSCRKEARGRELAMIFKLPHSLTVL